MHEEHMLEITRRYQSELRQIALAGRDTPNPTAVAARQGVESRTLGSRLRDAWEATVRPLRPQTGRTR